MRLKLLAFAATAALLAASCGREAEAQKLDVTGRDYAFEGLPSKVTGGRIDLTLRNQGKVEHEVAAIRIGNLTYEAFAKGFDPVIQEEGAPFPSWMKTGGSAAHAERGKSVTTSFNLEPGRYMFFCGETGKAGSKKEGPPHYKLGMRQIVDVEGDNGLEVSAPGGTFTARDYSFTLPAGFHGGKQTFLFRNDGPDQWHFMALMLFPKGITPAQAENAVGKFLKAGENAPPPKGVPQPKDVGGTGIFAPGLGGTFEMNFLSGRTYVGLCFISDKKGGPPHAIAHHMYKAFAVP